MRNLNKILNIMACAGLCAFAPFVTSCSDNDEPGNSGNNGGSKYEAVDLGLSVKWATMNVGAEKPSDYGDYFAWGETVPKLSYTGTTCILQGADPETMISKGIIDSKEECLTAKYDAATANWGSDWRMPTRSECWELVEECTWTWTNIDGHYGYKVEGPNKKSIFLPASGSYNGDELKDKNEWGHYWTSSHYGSYGSGQLVFLDTEYGIGDTNRWEGFSVRPVRK